MKNLTTVDVLEKFVVQDFNFIINLFVGSLHYKLQIFVELTCNILKAVCVISYQIYDRHRSGDDKEILLELFQVLGTLSYEMLGDLLEFCFIDFELIKELFSYFSEFKGNLVVFQLKVELSLNDVRFGYDLVVLIFVQIVLNFLELRT